MARYANILNDDAFKVIIFTPGNEELMAWMLEVLLPGKTIRSLEFRPTEQHGLAISDIISNYENRTGSYRRKQLREGTRGEAGRAEEKRATAKSLRDLGVEPAIIVQATGLSAEEIRAL